MSTMQVKVTDNEHTNGRFVWLLLDWLRNQERAAANCLISALDDIKFRDDTAACQELRQIYDQTVCDVSNVENEIRGSSGIQNQLHDAASLAKLLDCLRYTEHTRTDGPSFPRQVTLATLPQTFKPIFDKWSSGAAIVATLLKQAEAEA